MISQSSNCFRLSRKNPYSILLSLLVLLFCLFQAPLIFERPSQENVTERQAQTAGMARIYCRYPERHPIQSPQLPFGLRPFNLEFSVFEWAIGNGARLINKDCRSVEPIFRVVSVIFSALAVVLIYLLVLSSRFAGAGRHIAALLAATALAFDWLWIKFGSFTIVDSRVVCFGLLGMYFLRKRSYLWGAFFWALTITVKPQVFGALAPFYVTWELIESGWRRQWGRIASLGSATAIGILYYKYSVSLNAGSDLPWLTWTGPRSQKWFLGEWHERFQFSFYKATILDTLKRNLLFTSLCALVVAIFSLKPQGQRSRLILPPLLAAAPYLVGRFCYTFVFLNVFKVHDYYALPLNGMGALSRGLVVAAVMNSLVVMLSHQNEEQQSTARLLRSFTQKTYMVSALLVFALAPLLWGITNGAIKQWRFVLDVKNPKSPLYLHDWDIQLFPKDYGFVVVANASRGRDYLMLYLTRQFGYGWCATNPEHAPRAFWKSEGVTHVAWPNQVDPTTGKVTWMVHTINQELEIARKNGWSSDTNDHWAGKTMAEWAAISSTMGKDPCDPPAYPDPRLW